MKIIDLDSGDDFYQAVKSLEEMLICSQKNWDLIVAIPTGGKVVLDNMSRLTKDNNICFIEKQRKSTATKNRFNLSSFLPLLPRWLNNILRRLESSYLERKFEANHYSNEMQFELIPIKNTLKQSISECKNILIIDDAIDSGRTMKIVKETILKENPAVEIDIAAINTTFKKPLERPDYVLFSRTIVRYPWANDVKQ